MVEKTTKWLSEELKRLDVDHDVYLPYIMALLSPEESCDSVLINVKELLSSLVSTPDAEAISKELLKRWLEEDPSILKREEERKLQKTSPPIIQKTEEDKKKKKNEQTPSQSPTTKEKKQQKHQKSDPPISSVSSTATKPRPTPEEVISFTGDIAYFDQGETLFTGNRLSLIIADTLILDNGQLSLVRGKRYGLLGSNGCGKSTLLRALRMEMSKKGARRIHYVGQTDAESLQLISDGANLTVLEHVMTADARRTSLQKEADLLNSKPNLGAEDAERLGEIMSELDSDSSSNEQSARALLKRLGFHNPERKVSELSGGWRTRLEITRALWAKPDVLMLDEPTNHCDLEAVLQLAGLLLDDPKRTLLLVSHDAAFLDLVCTDTICIHMCNLKQFDGPYSAFEEYVNQQHSFHEDIYNAREKKEQALKQSVIQQRQRAARSGDSASQKNAASREKKLSRVGLYREDGKRYKLRSLKVLDVKYIRLPLRAEPVREGKGVNMKFPAWITPIDPANPASSNLQSVIETTPLVIGPKWGKNGKPLLKTPTLSVSVGDRIALIAKNGEGKSTLIRAIAGQLDSEVIADGSIRIIGASSIALIDQNQLAALEHDMEMTPLQWIIKKMGSEGKPRPEEDGRKQLNCFAIGSEVAETPIAELSGGLRVRLLLAGVFAAQIPPKILLLDEPTNHLDGESILAFAELCNAFPGAIIGISHNVAFLLQVFHDLWIIQNGALCISKTSNQLDFIRAFSNYAEPLIGGHKQEFANMLKIRAARSTLVEQSVTTTTSLII